ncbi:PAS domain S-box protein [Leptothoe sp. PORK10 BA2]|uniref:PAS domain S-box protein n=1 Tax=Leptothoe sp. PORK10 BA2 TaxID=3110254 RepID=UPI002B1F4B47|nr:PAS domain S-box protein [Leptothoe sp. PORK10 BA2]MEA5465984.1 PAS domain S-box protein [Leptothoe sp. PORK10 BA2]
MLNIPLLSQYMPHGYCYLWKPSLVGLHLVSDTLIGLAYYSIPITLLYFLKKRRDVPFQEIFLLFAAFIIFCGTTHLANVWTLWHSDYWVSGVLKALTAVVSTYTAIALIPIFPKALDLRTPAELEALNQQLEQEIAERRQTEVELRELSTRLDLALEAVGIGIWDWDIIHNRLIWDDRLYALYGSTPEAFEGNIDTWARYVHPEDRPAAEAALQRALRNEAVYDSEFRVIHADGTVRYLKGNALIQRNEQGEPIRMIGTDYDITERKAAEHQLEQEIAERRQTEVELRELSTRLDLALEAVGIGIWDWDITHNTLTWDDRFYELYGTTSEAFERNYEAWANRVHPEDRPAAEAAIQRALRNEEIYDIEFRVIHADGTVRYMKANGLIQRDDQEAPIRMIGTNYDITDRKEAEHRLMESEERFSSLSAAAPVGIFRANTEGNYIYVNEHLCEIAQLLPEQMLGTGWVQALYPEDQDTVLAAWHQSTSQNLPFVLEYRFGSPSGPITWVYEKAVPEYNYANQGVGYVGCLTDITDRKQAELRLKAAKDEIAQKEALFRSTFEQAAVGICHVSTTGHFARLNQRFCQLVGYSRSELLNLTFQNITYPEDLDADLTNVQQLLAGQLETFHMEKRYIRKDGTVTWVNLTCSLVRRQGGDPDYLISVVEDINARKQTEEMLRLYERAICTTPDHMSFVDRNYTYAMVNDVYAQKFGKSKAEIIGHSVTDLLGEKTFVQTIKPNLDRTFAGEEVHYQSLFSITDELQQYLDVTYTPCREVDGTISGAVVSVRDISDIYAAEVALTYQARRAEALLELPQLAEQLDEYDFMQQVQDIAKNLTGSQMAFLYFVHEEQATFELIHREQQPLTTLGNTDAETHLPIDPAGILADVLHHRQPVICNCACGVSRQEQALLQAQGLLQAHEQFNRLLSVPVIENGKVVMLTEVGNKSQNYTEMDIETVQLISNLVWRVVQHYRSLQTVRLLAAVVESTDDAIITKDLNGLITSWNAGAEKFLGYSALAAIGQSIQMLVPTDQVAEAAQTLERLRQGKSIEQVETVRCHKDGRLLDVSLTISPLQDGTGQVIGGSTIMRDISARKVAEQKLNVEIRARQQVIHTLKLTAKRLEESNQELQDFAYVASHDLQEPLRKVQVFGDRLSHTCQDQLSEKGQDYLARMLNAAVRAQALINDLLSFSRVATQAKPFIPTDLSQVMAGVLSDLEVRIEQTGATVDVDPLPTIDADQMQMQQILQNLLSNALKFHKPGVAPQIQVRVQCYPMAGKEICELRVIDNGIGFDVRYCDRIFQPFQRLHGRNTYEGSGIGLAICRKVIRRHEGTLRAESQPGEGATFIVTLPIHHPQEEENASPTQ